MRKIYLNLNQYDSSEELQDAIAKSMGFPAWYGKNMDALYDCLTEISEHTCVVICNIENKPELEEYMNRVMRVFRDAEEENEALCIVIESLQNKAPKRRNTNMSKKAISTTNAPAAIGPYSQAIEAGNTIYVSGQLGLDPATGKFPGDDTESQARQSLTNIRNILQEAGADLSDVVTVTVLITDLGDFAAVNKIYGEFFAEPYPARACYEVSKLPAGGKIEIQVVAIKP